MRNAKDAGQEDVAASIDAEAAARGQDMARFRVAQAVCSQDTRRSAWWEDTENDFCHATELTLDDHRAIAAQAHLICPRPGLYV